MEREPGDQRRASLRASDADREQLVETLRQHHADGPRRPGPAPGGDGQAGRGPGGRCSGRCCGTAC